MDTALCNVHGQSEVNDEGQPGNESDDEIQSNIDNVETQHVMRKKVFEKITRAKRNKAKMHKLRELETQKAKAEKKMSRDISSVKALVKQMNADEVAKQIKKKNKMDEKTSKQEYSLNYFDAGVALLTDELSGSLRTLRTRVCPLRAQVASMVSAGKAAPKNSRKRRAFEKPHAGKKVKWVAKYKY